MVGIGLQRWCDASFFCQFLLVFGRRLLVERIRKRGSICSTPANYQCQNRNAVCVLSWTLPLFEGLAVLCVFLWEVCIPHETPTSGSHDRRTCGTFAVFFFAVFHGWTRKRLSLSRSSLARHDVKPARSGGTLDEDSFSQRSSPESRVHNSTPIVPPSVTSLSRVDFGPWAKYTPPLRVYISNALFPPLSPHSTPLESGMRHQQDTLLRGMLLRRVP